MKILKRRIDNSCRLEEHHRMTLVQVKGQIDYNLTIYLMLIINLGNNGSGLETLT